MLLPTATRGEGSMGEQPLTIGIEEEFQIVDSGGELKAHIDTLLAAARTSSLVDDVRAEMLQSVVEVGTRICADVAEARAEVLRLRGGLAGLLNPEGLRIASAVPTRSPTGRTSGSPRWSATSCSRTRCRTWSGSC
jgi:gamma-glutamyl:cysteine ligase YbdK (ATP-grasp superfamily)